MIGLLDLNLILQINNMNIRPRPSKEILALESFYRINKEPVRMKYDISDGNGFNRIYLIKDTIQPFEVLLPQALTIHRMGKGGGPTPKILDPKFFHTKPNVNTYSIWLEFLKELLQYTKRQNILKGFYFEYDFCIVNGQLLKNKPDFRGWSNHFCIADYDFFSYPKWPNVIDSIFKNPIKALYFLEPINLNKTNQALVDFLQDPRFYTTYHIFQLDLTKGNSVLDIRSQEIFTQEIYNILKFYTPEHKLKIQLLYGYDQTQKYDDNFGLSELYKIFIILYIGRDHNIQFQITKQQINWKNNLPKGHFIFSYIQQGLTVGSGYTLYQFIQRKFSLDDTASKGLIGNIEQQNYKRQSLGLILEQFLILYPHYEQFFHYKQSTYQIQTKIQKEGMNTFMNEHIRQARQRLEEAMRSDRSALTTGLFHSNMGEYIKQIEKLQETCTHVNHQNMYAFTTDEEGYNLCDYCKKDISHLIIL